MMLQNSLNESFMTGYTYVLRTHNVGLKSQYHSLKVNTGSGIVVHTSKRMIYLLRLLAERWPGAKQVAHFGPDANDEVVQ